MEKAFVPASRLVVVLLAGVLATASAVAGDGVQQDLQQWTVFRVSTPIEQRWTFSFEAEGRFGDDISEVSEVLVKAYATYEFSKKFDFTFGYNYVDKPEGSNEQVPWQQVAWLRKHHELAVSHRIRLEERIIDDVSGIVPRLDYLGHFARPIGRTNHYWAALGTAAFNLVDRGGSAPVGGFEQARLYGGVGFHIGGHTRIEVGYLYRFERTRTGPDKSDHVIQLQFLFNTRAKKVKKPLPTDSYR